VPVGAQRRTEDVAIGGGARARHVREPVPLYEEFTADAETAAPNGTPPDQAVATADADSGTENNAVAADSDSGTEGDAMTAETEGETIEAQAEGEAITEAEPALAAEAQADEHEPSFRSELLRAMQATVATERARIDEETNRRREALIAAIETRREQETARMREMADEDLKSVDTWAAGERARIEEERERRAAAVRDDLEVSLTEHRAQIDREVEGVEGAVTDYRAEVDAFFARLDAEEDPVVIAQYSGSHPLFPTQEVIAARVAATTSAAGSAPTEQAETPAVGVMDLHATETPAEHWTGWTGPAEQPPTEGEGVTGQPAGAEEPREPVRVAAAGEQPAGEQPTAEQPANGSILQSLPVSRPFGWMRRDREGDDKPIDD
jgi:Sds3-like